MTEFHALGGVSITADGHELSLGGPRQRRLLAMLLIHRGAVVSVDRLADAVFAGEPTAAASTTLRSYIARIRRVIDGHSDATVVTKAPGYELRLPAESFDVARFERVLAESGALLARGDPAAASTAAGQALALWRGSAYAEFADEDWARPEAQRLEELRLVAHDRYLDAELACGRSAGAVGSAEALVGEYPYRESFWNHLIVALVRSGRQPEALRACSEHRRVLGDELGLEPSPAMVELERRVVAHDPTLITIDPAGQPLRGYHLGERLRSRPGGTLFAARIPGEMSDVTIEVVDAATADDPDFVRCFDADAQRVASLRDRSVVPLVDHWREPGAAFVVSRRMHGGTLTDRIERGPTDPALLALVASRIGDALEACGEQGIVHGCVDADSVVFDATRQPFLADVPIGVRRPGRSIADDRRGFAALLRRCVPDDHTLVDELERAMADGASIADLVAAAVTGLATEPRGPAGPRPNPFKGLRAFDEPDAADFFGRAALLDELVARLAGNGLTSRMVLLVGGSGTGKSSAVRAGLLPRIRRGDVPGSDRWFVTTMLPGASPFTELAQALRHVAVGDPADLAERLAADDGIGIDRVLADVLPEDGCLLLVVDQLEELFTMASDGDQRRFLNGVVRAATAPDGRLRVVATLRADFFDRPLAVAGFAEVVDATTVSVTAMGAVDVEAAIVEPATRVGLTVERPLVAELVNAVVDQPAALPSLQYVLYELAERAVGSELTLAAYREVGGLVGAITARADSLYSSLDDAERAAVRQMFERLVVVHPDGTPTRRRAERAELVALGDGPTLGAVIDRWAGARLLTLDRHPTSRLPTVEVAHEALLREWDRLRAWIDEDRSAIVAIAQLRDAATVWEELGHDPGALYRGARLELALQLSRQRARRLPPLEQSFVDASTAARDAEEREAAMGVARQARTNRRLRIQLGAVGIALVVAIVAGAVAVDRGRAAGRERAVAQARELSAAADMALDGDPELSVHLALAAVEKARADAPAVVLEAENALRRAVATSRAVLTVPGLGGWLDWSPDGTMFVTEGPEESGLIDLRDAETGASLRVWRGHDADVNFVAFSPDGSRLATTGDDGALRLWDPATSELLWEHVDDEHATVFAPTFSGDGARVVASWRGGPVRTFDVATGVGVGNPVWIDAQGLSASRDGRSVAFVDVVDGSGIADLDTGDVRAVLSDGRWETVRWSPDGRYIAAGASDGSVELWSPEGDLVATAAGHVGVTTWIDWGDDSARLVTAGEDGTVRLWTVADDRLREELVLSDAANGGVAAVAFSPDGERVIAGDFGMSRITVWDVSATGGAEWGAVQAEPHAFRALSFTPDGRRVMVSRGAGGVDVVDPASGQRTTLLEPRGGDLSTRIELSPDGNRLAVSTGVDGFDLIDVASASRIGGVSDAGGLAELAWSGDGAVLAASLLWSEVETAVVVFDRDGTELARYDLPPDTWSPQIAVSRDGRLVAMTHWRLSRDDTTITHVTIWDWRADKVVATIQRDESAWAVAFDASGDRVVIGSQLSGQTDVWDIASAERLANLVDAPLALDVAVSPDDSVIATGHPDGVVRLWDAESGARRLELTGHDDEVNRVVFSADGSRLGSVSQDGMVRVWAVDLDDLVQIAASRITRPMSDDECREYLHLDRCATD